MARLRLLQQVGAFSRVSRHPALTRPFYPRTYRTSAACLTYKMPEIHEEDAPFIVKSPYSDVEIPEMNLADYVWKDVDKWPERTALVSFFSNIHSLKISKFKIIARCAA